LTIYSTGRVRGTISYGEIEIERGGQMTGEIRLGTESDKANSAKKVAA
jgi:cytoskeletal protein CcmA (bactofilin family)